MPGPELSRVVLVRYGEVGLKGSNRAWFERTLAGNLRRALRHVGPCHVEDLHGRLLVRPEALATDAGLDAMSSAAARVFGVVGAVAAWETPLDIEAIREAARALVRAALASSQGGPLAFKVSARRSNRRFPMDSMEINRDVGADLLRLLGARLQVDVHRPALTVHVEVRDEAAYVYGNEQAGPGGLPIGVSGRALALVSGGIDSPVASWMAMKRGLYVDAVHFHAMPFTSEQARLKVLRLVSILAGWQGRMRVFVSRFTEVQKAIYANCPADLGVLLMRRMMVRIATRLAERHRYDALVTGENLGQVASQTVPSMAVVEAVSGRIVLRPLLAWDKSEIVDVARRIGTYETSIEPYEDCCTLFVARHPQTRPRFDRVEEAESKLDVDGLVDQALEQTEVVEASDAVGVHGGGLAGR
ncbi:tRNA uracil 4-sulfurtransferase ThiI [Carboxydochorda subterranea]|uniref:Probable tRNA sulfurtransferase n=1 Tax=Carboxydichorda subterranea TaxID=3109565 RepID=A0ABZ1BWD2_9FIRM|nr:tRNA uracil 4-sulfurtransferase ThiI [Limnochorda sp. L945t]WRP17104.1 tRNA uracil 4-sulfurtransferase ThiI [Limnochorda sp. L945t]